MALATLYDYEWINNAIYFGQLKRHNSYFSNSEFASSGLPQGEELKTLESIQELIAQDIFTTPFLLEKGDGSGMDRNRLKKAAGLFHKAGYTFKDGAMRDKAGNPLRLSILIGSKGLQKQLLPFRQSLAKLGITLNIRLLDSTHYVEKVRSKDFQMIITRYRQSLSPGNEQRNMWHSESADEKGSRNYIGLQDKAIDALVELVINAPDRKTLTARTKALDRLLLYGHYMIPLGYSDRYRIAIWDKFGRPETLPTHGLSLNAWWVDQEKEARLPDQLVSKTQK